MKKNIIIYNMYWFRMVRRMRRKASAYAMLEFCCCLWGRVKTLIRNASILNSVRSSGRWIIGSIAIVECIFYRRNFARWIHLNGTESESGYTSGLRDFGTLACTVAHGTCDLSFPSSCSKSWIDFHWSSLFFNIIPNVITNYYILFIINFSWIER